jgi:hypothetical protein
MFKLEPAEIWECRMGLRVSAFMRVPLFGVFPTVSQAKYLVLST